MKLEEMSIYNDGIELAKAFRDFFKVMSRDDQYSYGQQMLRSSCSIPSNIAEGFGKRASDKMFLNYLYIARGSLYEFKTQLKIIENDYLGNKLIVDMKKYLTDIDEGMTKFIFFMNKSK